MKIWTVEEEAERLRSRFESVSNKSAFALKYKVPGGASMLSQHLSGNRPISLDAATAYAQGFGVPLGEISPRLAEKAIAALATTTEAASAVPELIDLENHPDLLPVRTIKLKLQCGISGFAVEAEEESGTPIFFRADWFAKRGYCPGRLHAIKVAGESMEPTLYEGDAVVINTADFEPRDGEVYAINNEGEPVVKRVIRDDGKWWMQSDNQDQRRYPRKSFGPGTIIVGRVVHRQSERI